MRALFCSLAGDGFILSQVGLALECVQRGHSVAFATDLTMSSLLESVGLERIGRGALDGASFQVPLWAHPEAMAIQVKHLGWAIKCFRPDLIISQHLCMGAVIIAEMSHIPVVTLGGLAYLWPSAYCYHDREVERHRQWRYADVWGQVMAARKLCGLGLVQEINLNTSRFFLRSVPELQSPGDLPGCVRYAGACLWEPQVASELESLDQWASAQRHVGRRIVYVQQGRYFDAKHFWPQLVIAAKQEHLAVLASTAAMDCEIGQLPGNFYTRPRVPVMAAMQYADLLVSSANSTAVIAACSAGIPSLLFPRGGEQPDVAAVCQNAGIAHVLSLEQATSRNIAEFISNTGVDSPLRFAGEKIKQAFDQYEGFSSIAIQIEKQR